MNIKKNTQTSFEQNRNPRENCMFSSNLAEIVNV
jgi:hypothetical protein